MATNITGILKAEQQTQQTTASTSYADVTGTSTSATVNGVSYLVVYRGNQGADTASRLAFLQCMMGSTQIGEGGGEAANTRAVHYIGPHCSGFRRITGDGSSVFKFMGKTNAGTGRFGALSIVAIPMTNFGTQGTHWHADTTNATTEVLSNVATGTPTAVLSKSWDFGASGQWLLLGSYETDFDAFTASRGTSARMVYDGTTLDCIMNKEGENALDIYNWTFATVETLAGTKTVSIDCSSTGTAETDARRPNLIAIRADAWSQIVRTQYENVRRTTSSLTFVGMTDLDTTVTPVSSGATFLTIVSGNYQVTTFAEAAMQKLRNDTDGVDFCTDASDSQNNNSDDSCMFLFAAEALTGTKSYKLFHRVNTGTNFPTSRIPANDNERVQLISWELSLPGAAIVLAGGGAESTAGAGAAAVARALTGTGIEKTAGAGALGVSRALAGAGIERDAGAGALGVARSLAGSGAEVTAGAAAAAMTIGFGGEGVNVTYGDALAAMTIGLAGDGMDVTEGGGDLDVFGLLPRVIFRNRGLGRHDAVERASMLAAECGVLGVSATERVLGISAQELADFSSSVRNPVTYDTVVVTWNGDTVYWE